MDVIGLIHEFTPSSDIEATYPAAGPVVGKRYVLFHVDHHGGYQGGYGHFENPDLAYLGLLDDSIRLMESTGADSSSWKPLMRIEEEPVNGLPLSAISWPGADWMPWGVLVRTSAKVNLEAYTQEREGCPDPGDEMDDETESQFWDGDVCVQFDAIIAKYGLY